jgi:S1-C subfamily serine protease
MNKLALSFFLGGVILSATSLISSHSTRAEETPLFTHINSGTVSEISTSEDVISEIASSPIPVRNIVNRVVSIKSFGKQGSGVLVGRFGNTYSVLTNAHVVDNLVGQQLRIVMSDGRVEMTKASTVKIPSKELDLAIVTFKSNKKYPIAELGDSSVLARKQKVYAIGFVKNDLRFEPGKIVAASAHPQQDGYQIAVGQANITQGMSGGGLFDCDGKLIGISGKSIGADPTYKTRFRPVSGLAIPIDTFKQIVDDKLLAMSAESKLKTSDDFFIAAGNEAAKGNYHAAISNYTRALTIDPNLDEVYFRRGISRMVTQDWKNAEADFGRAIESNPNYIEAYVYRARTRTVLGNSQGANADSSTVISLKTNIPKKLYY